MFSGHYDDWINSRMNGIKKYIYPDYFKSKTLLELGSGYAHNGHRFHELGANVTSADARAEYLVTANNMYPHIKTYIMDADIDDIHEKYDIILHWGLLYHLNEIENHIEKISHKCNVLLLETEVSDSNDSTFCIKTTEDGYDQSFNARGIRPSPAYVEKVLQQNGFRFKIIKDPILNSEFHMYDWTIKNTATWAKGLRRFWICWKNVESPIISKMKSVICTYENPLRVAVVFVGRATCYKDSYEWFEDIAKRYDVHFYCSLNSDIKPYEDFIEMYNIKKHNLEKYQVSDDIKNASAKIAKTGVNQLSMFYNLMKGVDLIPADEYDIILYARTDCVYRQQIKLTLSGDTEIYIPSGHDYTGTNDQMCYGSPGAMKKYASLYKNIVTYIPILMNPNTNDIRPEDFVKHHIETVGLTVHRFDLEYKYNSKRRDNKIT